MYGPELLDPAVPCLFWFHAQALHACSSMHSLPIEMPSFLGQACVGDCIPLYEPMIGAYGHLGDTDMCPQPPKSHLLVLLLPLELHPTAL